MHQLIRYLLIYFEQQHIAIFNNTEQCSSKLKRNLHFIYIACCSSYISLFGAQIVGLPNITEVLLCPIQKDQGAQGKQWRRGLVGAGVPRDSHEREG